jgi:hypothetical protein
MRFITREFSPRTSKCETFATNAPEGVFQVGNGAPANFSDGRVKVSVNGTAKETAQAGTQTLGAFINAMATKYGVRTFSTYADGRKLTPQSSEINGPASAIKELELVAKDSRG